MHQEDQKNLNSENLFYNVSYKTCKKMTKIVLIDRNEFRLNFKHCKQIYPRFIFAENFSQTL